MWKTVARSLPRLMKVCVPSCCPLTNRLCVPPFNENQPVPLFFFQWAASSSSSIHSRGIRCEGTPSPRGVLIAASASSRGRSVVLGHDPTPLLCRRSIETKFTFFLARAKSSDRGSLSSPFCSMNLPVLVRLALMEQRSMLVKINRSGPSICTL